MDYAVIENGIVTNVIWLHYSNAHEFPDAVPLNGVPAGIGDTYDGEHFYRDGERVLTEVETLAVRLADAEAALTILGVNAEVTDYE